ncbi:MAG: polysaccharide biosynthesis tyrosine autokinase [Sedimentisphaerales bacterium]|nr:polysaccharide biosynthesis tyrosine autokinase [Sedimentisphaerales bacterium]
MEYQQIQPEFKNEYALQDMQQRQGLLARVVSKRWRIILASAVVALGITSAWTYFSPPKYSVSSRLFVEHKSPRLMIEQNNLMSGSRNFLSAQAEMVRSMPVISEMLANPDIVALMSQVGITDQIDFLRNEIKVSAGLKDDIVTVAGITTEPLWLADIINSMVDTYIAYNNRVNNRTSLAVVHLLQKEKDKTDAELLAKQTKLRELARENGVIDFEREGTNIEITRMATISEALTESELELASVQTLYDTVNALADKPDQIRAMAVAEGKYTNYLTQENSLRLRLQELEMQLSQLNQQATLEHPAVAATWEEISSVRRQLDEITFRLAREYTDSIIHKWVVCTRNVSENKRRLEEQKSIAWALNSKATEYALIKNDIDRLEDICSTLDRRIKEETVSAGSESMNITILERADVVSSVPVSSRAKAMATGLIAGLWLGLALAFVRELTDKNVRTAEDVNEATSLPLLGTIPALDSQDGIRKLGLTTQVDASSQAAEAFREIWSALYYRGIRDNRRAVMITSPQAGAGKSFVASNLAIIMAHAGLRVLLIDADLRNPTQHKIHGTSAWLRAGLADILEGGLDVLPDCIISTSVANLDMLSSGSGGFTHSELLAGDVFRQMLEVLKNSYDRIIIDTPPVLELADARIMASVCDSTVLVVRADQSRREQCTQATAILTAIGAELAGVIVNDIAVNKNSYSYKSYQYGKTSSVR